MNHREKEKQIKMLRIRTLDSHNQEARFKKYNHEATEYARKRFIET